jgi:hypothetical protein
MRQSKQDEMEPLLAMEGCVRVCVCPCVGAICKVDWQMRVGSCIVSVTA